MRYAIYSGIPEISAEASKHIYNYLQNFQFSEAQIGVLFYDWNRASADIAEENYDHEKMFFPDIIRSNLEAIEKLEKRRPGSCSILFRKFNISNFCRYSTEIMVNQFDQIHSNVPYIVVAYPQSDWNNAFLHDENNLEQLY